MSAQDLKLVAHIEHILEDEENISQRKSKLFHDIDSIISAIEENPQKDKILTHIQGIIRKKGIPDSALGSRVTVMDQPASASPLPNPQIMASTTRPSTSSSAPLTSPLAASMKSPDNSAGEKSATFVLVDEAATASPQLQTDIDTMLELVLQRGTMTLLQLTEHFRTDAKRIEEWGKVLENKGFIT